MTEMNLMSLGEQENNELLRQAVAVLPWGHNLLMMNKNLSDEQTIFYAKEVISLLKIVSSEMDKIDE